MFRKTLILFVFLSFMAFPTVYAQDTPPPPPGFYDALADVNAQIGQSITLNCTNPNDGSTCNMSDTRLNWEWLLQTWPDGSIGCTGYSGSETRAYLYEFTWQDSVYSYRQPLGGAVFLCSAAGAESLQPTPDDVTASACPMATRLATGGQGQVTPSPANNLRAQPGTTQNKVGEIPGEGIFTVLAGPVCTDDINYWQVNYQGSMGWTGEGKDGTYWVNPYGAQPSLLNLPANRAPLTTINVSQIVPLTSINALPPLTWSGYGVLAVTSLFPPQDIAQNVWLYDTDIAKPKPLPTNALLLDIAFSPTFDQNAALIATLTTDLDAGIRLQVWDTFIATERYSIQVPQEAHAITFSIDGTLLAVASGEGFNPAAVHEVLLYNTQTAQLVGQLPQNEVVSGMAFSGNLLATGSGQSVRLWDVATQSQIATLPAQADTTQRRMLFNPDGSLLAVAAATPPDASGFSRFMVEIWDVATRTQVRTIPASIGITGLDFSPDGSLLAVSQSGIQDLTGLENITVWDVQNGTPLVVVTVPLGRITDVTFSDDGTLLSFSNFLTVGDSQIHFYGVTQ